VTKPGFPLNPTGLDFLSRLIASKLSGSEMGDKII
jgi:hypothetical protein